jgi:hypothetical protein
MMKPAGKGTAFASVSLHDALDARTRRWMPGAAIALALAFAVAACGSASGTGSVGGATSSASPAMSAASDATRTSNALPATGPTASASPVAGGYDFCRLVRPAEAAAILARPTKDARRTSSTTALGPVGSCAYLSTDYSLTSQSIVNVVYLGNRISRTQYDEESAELRASAKPVPGLGETASFIPGLITVFDHGVAMTVQVIKGGVPAGLAQLTALAHKTLARTEEIR